MAIDAPPPPEQDASEKTRPLITFRSVILGMAMGLSLPLALAQVILLYIAYFTIAKYTAASGFSYLFPVGVRGGPIIESLVGYSAFGRKEVVGLGLVNSNMFFGNYRIPVWPALPHHLKLFSSEKNKSGLSGPFSWPSLRASLLPFYIRFISVMTMRLKIWDWVDSRVET
jgi:hypothetical protein